MCRSTNYKCNFLCFNISVGVKYNTCEQLEQSYRFAFGFNFSISFWSSAENNNQNNTISEIDKMSVKITKFH